MDQKNKYLSMGKAFENEFCTCVMIIIYFKMKYIGALKRNIIFIVSKANDTLIIYPYSRTHYTI